MEGKSQLIVLRERVPVPNYQLAVMTDGGLIVPDEDAKQTDLIHPEDIIALGMEHIITEQLGMDPNNPGSPLTKERWVHEGRRMLRRELFLSAQQYATDHGAGYFQLEIPLSQERFDRDYGPFGLFWAVRMGCAHATGRMQMYVKINED